MIFFMGRYKQLELKLDLEPREFEIWSEGYAMTGDHGGAHLMGKAIGRTFQEACDNYFKKDRDYKSKRLTYWGCRLYNNEKDARKSFG